MRLADEEDFHVSPRLFGNTAFLTDNRFFFDKYLDLRVKRFDGFTAFQRTFCQSLIDVHPQEVELAVKNMECTSYYAARFEERSAHMPIEEMWTLRDGLDLCLSIARNESASNRARLMAMRELDDLTGTRLKVSKLIADLSKS